jgi:hypothetical protein
MVLEAMANHAQIFVTVMAGVGSPVIKILLIPLNH